MKNPGAPQVDHQVHHFPGSFPHQHQSRHTGRLRALKTLLIDIRQLIGSMASGQLLSLLWILSCTSMNTEGWGGIRRRAPPPMKYACMASDSTDLAEVHAYLTKPEVGEWSRPGMDCDGQKWCRSGKCEGQRGVMSGVFRLRGGGSVLPAPGPSNSDGSLKKCAMCETVETQTTLGHCKITMLYFCAKKDCRRTHWLENKEQWRERLKAAPTTNSGMRIPVLPSHDRHGNSLDDDEIFPGDRVGASPEPERGFGEPFADRDPLVHKWDEDNMGINKVLWDAAGHNNLELVSQAVREGASVNAGNPHDMYHWTALHRAAYKGAVEAVEILIGLGAHVESTDSWQKTPLHLAAEQGHSVIIKILHNNGANMSALNKNNQTALHYAARDGFTMACNELVQAGTNPDVVDAQPWGAAGLTALDYATENAWDDCVKVLEAVTTVRTNWTEALGKADLHRRATLKDYSPRSFWHNDEDDPEFEEALKQGGYE